MTPPRPAIAPAPPPDPAAAWYDRVRPALGGDYEDAEVLAALRDIVGKFTGRMEMSGAVRATRDKIADRRRKLASRANLRIAAAPTPEPFPLAICEEASATAATMQSTTDWAAGQKTALQEARERDRADAQAFRERLAFRVARMVKVASAEDVAGAWAVHSDRPNLTIG